MPIGSEIGRDVPTHTDAVVNHHADNKIPPRIGQLIDKEHLAETGGGPRLTHQESGDLDRWRSSENLRQARDQSTDGATLARLARNIDPSIRKAIAVNESTSLEVLAKLLCDQDQGVRRLAGQRLPKTTDPANDSCQRPDVVSAAVGDQNQNILMASTIGYGLFRLGLGSRRVEVHTSFRQDGKIERKFGNNILTYEGPHTQPRSGFHSYGRLETAYINGKTYTFDENEEVSRIHFPKGNRTIEVERSDSGRYEIYSQKNNQERTKVGEFFAREITFDPDRSSIAFHLTSYKMSGESVKTMALLRSSLGLNLTHTKRGPLMMEEPFKPFEAPAKPNATGGTAGSAQNEAADARRGTDVAPKQVGLPDITEQKLPVDDEEVARLRAQLEDVNPPVGTDEHVPLRGIASHRMPGEQYGTSSPRTPQRVDLPLDFAQHAQRAAEVGELPAFLSANGVPKHQSEMINDQFSRLNENQRAKFWEQMHAKNGNKLAIVASVFLFALSVASADAAPWQRPIPHVSFQP